MSLKEPVPKQTGAVTLLTALALMMSLTIATLSVARTQRVEQQIANNDIWYKRLFLRAEAALAEALDHLKTPFDDYIPGLENSGDRLIHRTVLSDDPAGIRTEVSFSRPADKGAYIFIDATSHAIDRPVLKARASQFVRPLTLLTPLAETAPPLILNGCPNNSPKSFHIRPLDAESDRAGDAVWLNQHIPCSDLDSADMHKGQVARYALQKDLWALIFSIDKETFVTLSEEERVKPANERHYWFVQDADLRAGRWNHSLGSTTNPVVLYFPPATGCPEFSDGVRIFGLVFIDSACPAPIARQRLEVYGTLVVNGNLNIGGRTLHLNHIQVADIRQTRLNFPILRSVRVPGTWSDF